jgi:hypothetical protein
MNRDEDQRTFKKEVTRATIAAMLSGAFFFFDTSLGTSDPGSEVPLSWGCPVFTLSSAESIWLG